MQLPSYRFNEFVGLNGNEIDLISRLADAPVTYARNKALRRQGDKPRCVYLLRDGWVASTMALLNGRQQMVKLHIPGDMLGVPSLCLTEAAESLIALTTVSASAISHEALMSLFSKGPRIAASLFLSAQKERIALMDNLTAVGQMDARHRVAAMIFDLFKRLRTAGLVDGTSFKTPMTQENLADLTAMTPVHVNRTIQALRSEKMIDWRFGRITILDEQAISGFVDAVPRRYVRDPHWLPPAASGDGAG